MTVSNLGIVYYLNGDFRKALTYLKKSFKIQEKEKMNVGQLKLDTYIHICLVNKQIDKKNNIDKLNDIIESLEYYDFMIKYRLYEFFNDSSYLEDAFNEVQEMAKTLTEDLKAQFFINPHVKAIVEEWHKAN